MTDRLFLGDGAVIKMAPYSHGAMSWRHYRQITKLMATGQRLVALNNRLLQNQQPASNVFSQNIF